jgi:DnaJ-class molecular chaperone
MSDAKGYYETLGIKPNASGDEIKKAYRKQAFLSHPDSARPSKGDTTAKFHAVSEAYDVLGDEQKRKNYDRGFSANSGHVGNAGGMAEHFAHGNGVPQDIFEFFKNTAFGGADAFGGPGHHQTHFFHVDGTGRMSFQEAMQRPTPIVKTVQITLAQAFAGCKLPVEVERWVCDGSVKQKETETIYVSIPEGVDDNEIIVLRDKGNALSDSNKGHIKIFIKVSNTTGLERRGLDLLFSKTITLKEALCGFTFDMDYLDERMFKIDNHNGVVISPGYKKVIPGLGMKRGDHKGNLIIEFIVTFPERLTKEQIANIKEHI